MLLSHFAYGKAKAKYRVMVMPQVLQSDYLGLVPSSAIYLPCDLGKSSLCLSHLFYKIGIIMVLFINERIKVRHWAMCLAYSKHLMTMTRHH